MAGNRKAIKEILEDLMATKVGRNAEFNCLEDMELTALQRENLTFDEVFAMNLLNKALHGDMKASTEIMDRRYGKAQQHIIQEIKSVTYHDFLDNLHKEDENDNILGAENSTRNITPNIILDVPQIMTDITPVDGGSAEADLMNDLGL